MNKTNWAEEAVAAIERRARLNGEPIAGHPVASYPPRPPRSLSERWLDEAAAAIERRLRLNG